MKTWLRYTLLGVAAYVAFVVALFPADRVYATLKQQMAAEGVTLKVYGIDGTIWGGRAESAEFSRFALKTITWDLEPTALLLGRLQARLDFSYKGNPASVSVGRGLGGKVYMTGIEGVLPMSEVLELAHLAVLRLDGQLGLNGVDLTLDAGKLVRAEGNLAWVRAGTQFPQPISLGDINVALETVDEGVRATLKDGGGPLDLAGEFLLKPDDQYQTKIQLAAREGAQSPLGRYLVLLGRPNAQGKIEFAKNGALKDLGITAN